MKAVNSGKRWNKEDVLKFWNTPKIRYHELAKKLGRTKEALDAAHRTKEILQKIKPDTSFVNPRTSNYDKYMFELFRKGKKPKL